MFTSIFKPAFRYTALEGEKNGRSSRTSKASLRLILQYVVVCFCVAGASFWAGRYSTQDQFQPNLQLNTVPEVFRYNRTFGEPPSNTTNRAWNELFPEQGGFFKHPTIAPRRSAFSVFHQLHCLVSPPLSPSHPSRHVFTNPSNGIREGYWTAFQAATTDGRKLVEEELPMMASPPHIRHCIDLLRHALMCQPDTTIEVKDDEIGGVKGFGTEHQCRDWEQLVRWTSQWETYEQETRNHTHAGAMMRPDHNHNHP